MTEPIASSVFVDHFAADAQRLIDVASTISLDAAIAACPGWSAADLLRHIGAVHEMARGRVRDEHDVCPPPDGEGGLIEWYAGRVAALAATLRATDPATPCSTFGPPANASFWMRRQAHETAIHRADVERAAGAGSTFDPALAADGIAEVGEWYPRRLAAGRAAPADALLRLVATDVGETFSIGDPGRPAVSVAGPAGALYLLCWGRATLDDPWFEVEDRAAVEGVLACGLVP